MAKKPGEPPSGDPWSASTVTGPTGARSIRLPLLVAVTLGLLLSALPHLVAYAKTGSSHWVADSDELSLYLPVSARLYHGEGFELLDPVSPDPAPTVYPWSQLAPATVMARSLRSGPLSVSVIWRAIAGLTVSLGWFLLFHYWTRSGWLACAATILLMADSELLTGRLILRQLLITADLLSGGAEHLLATKPNLMPQWRIMTPGLSLGFLIAYSWALLRALDDRGRAAIALAGTAFGMLFYVYLYYWTAAGLSLLACAAFFPRDRAVFVTTGAIGCILGAPAVIAAYLFRANWSADWLARTDKFVEIGHFQELLIPKAGPLLALVATVYALTRQPRLRFLVVHVGAGLLLLNHQLVSGLQIENFHYSYFWGPLCSAVLVLGGLDLYRAACRRLGTRTPAVILIGLAVVQLTSGFYLRVRESTASRESVQINSEIAAFNHTQAEHPVPKVSLAVMAGDAAYLRLAAVLENQRPLVGWTVVFSEAVDDEQWSERLALNAVMSGDDERSFRAAQTQLLESNVWGPWARDPRLERELLQARLTKFRWAETNVAAALARYNVTYLVIARGAVPNAYIARNWDETRSGKWSVWANPHLPN